MIFDARYADWYDALYRDKDYGGECRIVLNLLREYRKGEVASVLDLGCGSGNHAIPLASAGLSVTGVDRSRPMLAHAERKACESGLEDRALFVQGDIRTCDLGRTFDAALMMFAVLGYQTETDDVIAALKTARRHLPRDGVFMFDCWYGPAVLTERPSKRTKTVLTDAGSLTRRSSSSLDVRTHTCQVDFSFTLDDQAWSESHRVRFFFPLEIELLLRLTGFQLVRLSSFPDIENKPGPATWNVCGVAVAQ